MTYTVGEEVAATLPAIMPAPASRPYTYTLAGDLNGLTFDPDPTPPPSRHPLYPGAFPLTYTATDSSNRPSGRITLLHGDHKHHRPPPPPPTSAQHAARMT